MSIGLPKSVSSGCPVHLTRVNSSVSSGCVQWHPRCRVQCLCPVAQRSSFGLQFACHVAYQRSGSAPLRVCLPVSLRARCRLGSAKINARRRGGPHCAGAYGGQDRVRRSATRVATLFCSGAGGSVAAAPGSAERVKSYSRPQAVQAPSNKFNLSMVRISSATRAATLFCSGAGGNAMGIRSRTAWLREGIAVPVWYRLKSRALKSI